jgi:hypothetical protein
MGWFAAPGTFLARAGVRPGRIVNRPVADIALMLKVPIEGVCRTWPVGR